MNNILTIQNNNTTNMFFNAVCQMYELFATEQFPIDISIPNGFENLIDTLYLFHNQNIPNKTTYKLSHINNISDNQNVIVGYSGGLDSAYLSLKLKDDGYNVTLLHLKGLNKSYPKEDIFAKTFAENNGFKYVELNVKHNQKQYFIDNPLKNQLVLSLMLDYGIENNINNFALGADWCTDLNHSIIGMTITDSIEVNKYFWSGVTEYFKNANLIFIDNTTKKYERLKYIINNHSDALNDIYSCISPHRFNNKLHNNNQIKFNTTLLNGRCGSCYKCCMEILLLSELGYMYDKKKDKELISHCWKILSDSKNSHGKEKFNKKLDYNVRLQNLLNYGS